MSLRNKERRAIRKKMRAQVPISLVEIVKLKRHAARKLTPSAIAFLNWHQAGGRNHVDAAWQVQALIDAGVA